jgi:ribosomal protein S6E (S10)
MHTLKHVFLPTILVISLTLLTGGKAMAQDVRVTWMKEVQPALEKELVTTYGEAQHVRITQGLNQVASFWRPEDGDAKVLGGFVRANFAGNQPALDVMFQRFEYLLEQLNGHMTEIGMAFREQSDLDRGTIYPFDELFAAYSPGAHVADDFFANKLAFVVLLNFPITTLDERLTKSGQWSRRQWAEARLAQQFSKRIPAEVNQAVAEAGAISDKYISEYNIYMHHVVDAKGIRMFPPKMRLLSHWNLRDELKSGYNDKEQGMARQKTIRQVMERIVTQTIPEVVVDNPDVDWNPFTNDVRPTTVNDVREAPKADRRVSNAPEPDTRYATLLKTFLASKKVDPYSPAAPTLIARRFEENREIPEAAVKAMLESVLNSPLVPKVARLIQDRLGRPLEPFDIWYNGFRPRSQYSEKQLDSIVSRKYPNADAYKADMPSMLMKLGFSKERAGHLANNILVEPARGSGHAAGAGMRSAKTRLRTRVGENGMDYKGYNIAVHEMGHNVEQTLSLNDVDHYLLNGVPNTAFTEAIAYVFQTRDLQLLGLPSPDANNETLDALNVFWQTYEISGVSLVDMEIWHWMYDHPAASAAELKAATLKIAGDIWNKYYAPVFKTRDVVLLAVYSHIIHSFLYLPDYAIGHLISHQIEEYLRGKQGIGPEIERMVKVGSVVPDVWMKNAVGSAVNADAMLSAAERALRAYK